MKWKLWNPIVDRLVNIFINQMAIPVTICYSICKEVQLLIDQLEYLFVATRENLFICIKLPKNPYR